MQIFEKFPHSGGLWVLDKVPKDLQELNGNTQHSGNISYLFSLC